MSSKSGLPRSRRLRSGLLVGLLCLGLAGTLWSLGRAWLWREIQAQAERQGVRLGRCRLDLGFRQLGLEACSFVVVSPFFGLGAVRAEGSVQRLDVSLSGLTPTHVVARGLVLVLRGAAPLAEWSKAAGEPSIWSFPVDVEGGALSWYFEPGPTPELFLSELNYVGATRRLVSKWSLVDRFAGELSLGDAELDLTLGDPTQPELRLAGRWQRASQRAELRFTLRKLRLRQLEGSWLELTDALRPVEVDGHLALQVPLGLTTQAVVGDVHLTLHALALPVPPELAPLVSGGPLKVSGKFGVERSRARASFRELSLLTGALELRGPAELSWSDAGVAFQAGLRGAVPCASIVESAARAQLGKPEAGLAQRIVDTALGQSAEVVASLQGRSSELARAQVLTSFHPGCDSRWP